jgi:hypothetical protein
MTTWEQVYNNGVTYSGQPRTITKSSTNANSCVFCFFLFSWSLLEFTCVFIVCLFVYVYMYLSDSAAWTNNNKNGRLYEQPEISTYA